MNDLLNDVEIVPTVKREGIVLCDEINKDLKSLNVEYKTNGKTFYKWYIDNMSIQRKNLILKIKHYRDINKLKKLSGEDITDQILIIEKNLENKIIRDYLNSIKWNGKTGTVEKFDNFAKLITGKNYIPLYGVIFHHMVWTHKVRVFDIEGKREYCPIFVSLYGKGDSGKTKTLEHIVSPMPANKYMCPDNASELFSDKQQTYRFIHNYAIILNELSGLDKQEVNFIKNGIDAEKKTFKPHYIQEDENGDNMAILFGTSNTRLKNVICSDVERDIRKWCEIDIRPIGPNEDIKTGWEYVELVRSVDMLDLYQSVNENEPSPLLPVYDEFKKWTAGKCSTMSDHSEYIRELVENSSGKFLLKRTVYDDGYCKEVKNPLKWSNFVEKCETFGFVFKRRNTGVGIEVPSTFFQQETI